MATGYPTDSTKEWATIGGKAGSWLQLTWSAPVAIDRVVLYDRPNADDQVTSATLSFSDGAAGSSSDGPAVAGTGSDSSPAVAGASSDEGGFLGPVRIAGIAVGAAGVAAYKALSKSDEEEPAPPAKNTK